MKEKNNAIEFWKFFFALGFAYFSFNVIMTSIENVGSNNLFTGTNALEFFLILAGFYMVSSFKELKKDNIKKISVSKYVIKQIKKLYPAIAGGVIIAFITRNFVIKTSITYLPRLIVGSLFEVLGISQLGIVSYISNISNSELIKYIANGGMNIIWNEPCIYLSCIIIVSSILFYFLSRNEELYKSVISPLLIIVGYGTLNYIGDYNPIANPFLGISSSLIRVCAAMALGSILYYLVEYFKKKEYNTSIKVIITIINFTFIIYFIWSFIYGVAWSEFYNILFIIPFMIISLIGSDYISKLIDNSFSKYLGNLSLYIFSSHIAFVYLIPYLFSYCSFNTICLIYLLAVIIWANVMYAVDVLIITPLFREK